MNFSLRLKRTLAALLSFALTTQPVFAQLKMRVPLNPKPTTAVGLISFSDPEVNFGNVPIGTTAARTLRLTNPASTSITLDSLRLTGEGFSNTSTCGAYLAASASCDVTVTFAPQAKQGYSATLTLVADLGRSTSSVSLTGFGQTGTLTLSPTEVAFDAPLQVGDAATPRVVTLTNTGVGPVSNIQVSVVNPSGAADFTQSNNCGSTLRANESCLVSVGFTPMAAGARNGALAIASDAFNGVQTAAVFGEGALPSGSVSAASFGAVQLGSSRTATSEVRNTGIGALHIERITTSGAPFSMVSSDCPLKLDAGKTCTVTSRFAPSEEGVSSGGLLVRATEAGELSATLTGSAQAPGAALSTPQFAAIKVGSQLIAEATLSNTGIDVLPLTPPGESSVSGSEFRFESTTCGTSLAVGQSCVVRVTFAPLSMGTKTGSLTMATAAGQRSVGLSGLGTEVKFSVSPTSVALGDVAVSTSKSSSALTVTNTGNLPLQGLALATSAPLGIEGSSCGATLAAGASCTFQVSLSASAPVSYSGQVQVSATNTPSVQFVSVAGQGVQGSLTLSATSLSFPDTQLGRLSAPLTVLLTNEGGYPLSLAAPSANGDFSVSGTSCGASLAVGASCFVSVVFAPTSASARTGMLTLGNDGTTGARTVSLSGAGRAQSATLSAVSFPATDALGFAQASATLTNTGVGPLAVTPPTSESVAGTGFSLLSTTCGAVLTAGGTCTVTLGFSPVANQDYSGTLTLDTGAGSKVAALNGTGRRAVLGWAPSAPLAFGDVQVGQTKDSSTLTLSNSGNATATGLALSAPAGYSMQGSTCSTSLAAGASCTVTVRFSPTAVQAYSGAFSATASSPAVGASVTVSGTGAAASATLSPISFGSVSAGSTSSLTATLTNTGVGPLSLTAPSAASVTGTSFAFSSSTCGTSVAVGASCTVTVVFSPTVNQAYSGTLSLATGAGSLSSVLSGTGTRAVLALSPTSLAAFGDVQVGQSKDSVSVTVTNTGNAMATTLGMVLPGGYSLQSNTCGATLAAGGTCGFLVRFSPLSVQAYSGTLTVSASSPATGASMSLTGAGVAQSASLGGLAFGSRAVGSTTELALALTNTGVGPLSLTAPTSASVTGAAFSFVSTTCGSVLAAGGTCTVTVRFSPTAGAVYSGSTSISTGAGTLTAALSGTGLQGTGTASTTSLAFGSLQVGQTSSVQSVTMTNNGTQALTFSGISVVTGASDFAQSNNCGSTLAVGASCSVNVAFTPSSTGTRSGTLVALHDGPGGRTDVTLSGTGVEQSGTMAAVAFGSLTTGTASTLTATLSNTGIGPLAVTPPTSASVTGAGFSFVSTTCSSSLAAGASCTTSVTFSPTANQAYSGTLSVSTGAGTLSSALTGTGTRAVLTISPNQTFNFGTVQIGQSADTSTITVTNSGNAAASGLALDVPSGFSLLSNTCGASLAANTSCSFVVRFSPTQAAAYSGTVTARATAPAVGSSITVQGSGAVQSATLSSITFGNVSASASSSANATLTNTGVGPLSLTAPTSASVSGSGFSFSSTTCGTVLSAGASCSITVTFAPTANQAYSGTVAVSTGAGALSGSLSGTGTRAVLGLSPASMYNFGNVQVGQVSDSSTVTLTNSGNATATSLLLSPGSGYSVLNNTCSSSLAAGAFCTFTIRFSPAAAQAYTTGLTVSAATPAVGASYAGTGTGVSPKSSLTSVAFGNVAVSSTSTSSATLTNTGIGPISVTAPSAASVTGAGFSYASTTCGSVLSAGASCTVSVTFAPTQNTSYSGTLAVTTGAGTATVSLSGAGTRAVLELSTSGAITYGNLQVGSSSDSSTLTLINTGNASAASLALNAPTGFSILNSTCGASLAAGASCTFAVRFSPAAAQGYSSSVTASAATPAAGTSVVVTGTGVAQSGSVTATAFGSRSVGSATDLTATLTNTGVGTLSLTAPTASSVSGTGFWFVSTTCGSSLSVGASCTVTTRFSPTDTIAYSGTLSVSTGGGIVSAALSGTGSGSKATALSSTTISLGTVSVGAAAPTASVTFRNDGNTSMTLSASAPWSPFSLVSNSCTSIAPGGSCTMTYSMATGTPGNYSGATSSVTGAAVGNTTVTLSGTVSGSVASLVTTSTLILATAGYGAAAPTAGITVRNDGNAPMTLTPSLSNTANFYVSSNSCSNVAAGNQCTIVFAGYTNAIGYFNGNLTLSGGSTGALTGTIRSTITGVSTTWSATSLNFGNVSVGVTTSWNVNVTNTGNITGNLQSLVNLPTDVTNAGCTSVLPGDTCIMTFYFKPTQARTYSGSGIYPSAANTVGNTLSVSGVGISTPAPSLAMSPTSWAAGSVQDNVTKSQTVTLTNSGGAGSFLMSIGSFVGTGTADLTYSRGTCPADGATFGAGASCTFTLYFTGWAQCGGSVRSQSATVTASTTNVSGTSSASVTFNGASYVYSLTHIMCR